MTKQKLAFLFPGQGAQYQGMGKDFFDLYPIAKRTFQEADDILSFHLSRLIFQGPNEELTKTKNAQVALYVTTLAILRVMYEEFPNLFPQVCAGLSLGEYSALEASGRISFIDGLKLVEKRAAYMNEACENTKGVMAAILGLDAKTVETVIKQINPPHKVWAANFNCPSQIVISGTKEGVEKGIEALKEKGAKRALFLQVHGAFHSGLMIEAQKKLKLEIEKTHFREGKCEIVMNVIGDYVDFIEDVKRHLIEQIVSSVFWEKGILKMQEKGIDLFVEVGCGETLKAMNKKIKVSSPTISISEVADLELLARHIG